MADALAAASSGDLGVVVSGSVARRLPTLLEHELGWQDGMLKALEVATGDVLYGKKRALLPPSGNVRPGAISGVTKEPI